MALSSSQPEPGHDVKLSKSHLDWETHSARHKLMHACTAVLVHEHRLTLVLEDSRATKVSCLLFFFFLLKPLEPLPLPPEVRRRTQQSSPDASGKHTCHFQQSPVSPCLPECISHPTTSFSPVDASCTPEHSLDAPDWLHSAAAQLLCLPKTSSMAPCHFRHLPWFSIAPQRPPFL